ncbi:transcriptional regulatory protein ZraR [bacterium BMS3Bbin05]|nr:transcriptional regulatory protein ZraR [bacterium BMS3Abin08]GBE31293.1 transcriptional regulatory protein ZraR [bacterium BMS3Bbin05]
MRVGGVEPFEVDIRILAASNSDLKKEVETGKFRKDLLYRLNVTIIDIPPLRNRKDDIPILAYHFLNKYNQRFSRKIKAFRPDTMELLLNYSWPGNVRELENVVEHAVIITQPQQDIAPEHLSMDIRKGQQSVLPVPSSFMRLDDMEQTLIQQALLMSNGHKAQAAKALGISTATLWRKLKKLRIG